MANKSRTIILTVVRHGQTNANKERVIHGWTDTPLNETGKVIYIKLGNIIHLHD